jgi:ribonucleoside-diphosphate reductase alpha chain
MLHKFVVNAFTDDAYFDFDKFRKCIRIFVRMLDNVVELAALPLPQQQAEIENKRRHGMGYMGLGSALAMMGIKYGSSQAVEFTEEVSKELAMTGFDEGVSLAIEKGMAPILEREFDAQDVRKYAELNGNTNLPSKLRKKLMGKDLLVMSHYFDPWRTDSRGKEILKRISKHGCRFTHHSSIAPTGTISASYGENCSNGIEPTFAHEYIRNVLTSDSNSKKAMPVYSYEFYMYRKNVPECTVDSLPDYFTTTDDLTPMQHVDMQAAAKRMFKGRHTMQTPFFWTVTPPVFFLGKENGGCAMQQRDALHFL